MMFELERKEKNAGKESIDPTDATDCTLSRYHDARTDTELVRASGDGVFAALCTLFGHDVQLWVRMTTIVR